MKMNEKEIVNALIARDAKITELFFFQHCKPLFMSIIKLVFSYEVDYAEFVNELYLYLMEKDAYRLRQFEGRSSLYQWLKIVAIRYFVSRRDSMIEMYPHNALNDCNVFCLEKNEEKTENFAVDIEILFKLMPNKRYVYVIRRLVLEDGEPKAVARELSVSVDNLYNIKRRALKSLTEIVLKEKEKYGTQIKK